MHCLLFSPHFDQLDKISVLVANLSISCVLSIIEFVSLAIPTEKNTAISIDAIAIIELVIQFLAQWFHCWIVLG